MKIADIHCHILPYVDDGAEHMEETQRLLQDEADQGVRLICATPHLRHGMFETPDEDVIDRFLRVRDFIAGAELPLELYLGREYFCDSTFFERLKSGGVIPLGKGDTVLVEFSGRYSMDAIREYVKDILKSGIRPLIAHVERYPNVTNDGVRLLRDMGALVQVNAGSLLGREGLKQKRHTWKLLKEDLVDVVASDAHDPRTRPVELERCADKIANKLGEDYATKVLWDKPVKILSLDKLDKGE